MSLFSVLDELFLSLAKSALPFDFIGLRAEEPNGVLGPRVGEPIADRVGDKFPALSLLCAAHPRWYAWMILAAA